MSFNVGDEVVCVDAATRDALYPAHNLKLGAHYTVTETGVAPNGDPIVRLAELHTLNPESAGFAADRFRIVKRENIEVFRAMCVSPKPLVPVE